LLEASQVIYWLCLAASRANLTYVDWEPHLALEKPHPSTPRDRFLRRKRSPFSRMERGSTQSGSVEDELGDLLSQVAELLAQTNVSPVEPVWRDLASLQQRLNGGGDGSG
jgi:hypothetical protein